MSTPRPTSLNRKLTLIVTLACGLALTTACLAFMAFDALTFRTTMVRDLSITAQIIGSNASAALQFGDDVAATEILAALAAKPDIRAACLFDRSGTPLASYYRTDDPAHVLPRRPAHDGHRFTRSSLELFQGIHALDGTPIGTLFIQHDLDAFYTRLLRYLGIAALVLLASMGVASLAAVRLKRHITEPIDHLAGVAHAVRERKDYSIRGTKQNDDEIGLLIDSFNEMLAEIQKRDAALARHRDQLEADVAARTQELRETNAALVEARDRAEAMSRLKSALLTNMTHEFRTPVAGIQGLAAVLQEELDGEQREFAQLIEDNSRRLMTTLTAVLDLARLEAGDMVPQPTAFHLDALVQTVAHTYTAAAERKGLALHVPRAAAPIPVTLDPYYLETILHHLLENAVKFTERGTVAVEVEHDGATARLRICDTGPGIPEAFLPRLFEPFKQASTGLSRSHEGTGLGLAIVRRLCDQMQATITLASRVDEGTTVTITLPRHQPTGGTAIARTADEMASWDWRAED